MTPEELALLKLADVTSAHARGVISAEEAGELWDSIAVALGSNFPEIVKAARSAASLRRESKRAEIRAGNLIRRTLKEGQD